MEAELKIVEGRKGGIVILLNGHKYTKKRVNKNGTFLFMWFQRIQNQNVVFRL